jgi:hypothetical protein
MVAAKPGSLALLGMTILILFSCITRAEVANFCGILVLGRRLREPALVGVVPPVGSFDCDTRSAQDDSLSFRASYFFPSCFISGSAHAAIWL